MVARTVAALVLREDLNEAEYREAVDHLGEAGLFELLTLVGYSVNDTIVVFDRIREVRGKNPDLTPQMINDSVNQTLSRTVLASLTTWLVVFVLYVWGGPGVHLFAFVMVVGNVAVTGEIYKLQLNGTAVGRFGKGGRALKEFASTHTLDCRNPNEIYAAEISSWRVQKITLRGPIQPSSRD